MFTSLYWCISTFESYRDT